jgi:hypothetical protein
LEASLVESVSPPRLGEQVPRWYGETIGFWDHDTLITWTSNIQAWASHTAFEHSGKLQTIEIYTPVRDVQGRFTGTSHEAILYDPEALVEPIRIIERMDKRAQRHKGRIKDHHSAARAAIAHSPAREQVFSGKHEEDSGASTALNPVVVSEGTTQMRKLSVGEAVMQLDLMEAPAFVFLNAAHGGLNVVYRRPDGNIGWIDPNIELNKR